jgi:hypothetical protein
MPTIRPNPPPAPAPAAKLADTARLAAQKAFFQIASGQAPSAAPAVQATPASVPTASVNRLADRPAEPPAKPLRPGSLLDIRV